MSITAGLTLHLKLDDLGGGPRVADSSGTNRNGSVNGAVAQVPDATFGRCAYVDGSGGYVSVPDPFPDPSTFTISLWVKPDGLRNDPGYHGFIGKQEGATRKPGLWWIAGRLHYDSYDAATRARFASELTGFFPTDDWTHVAWVKEGTQYRIYRNGTLVVTAPAPAQVFTAPGTDYWIGKIDNYFKGRIAAVRIYRRALTPAELREVAEDDRVLSITDGLTLHLKLDDLGSDPKVADSSGSGRDGTVNGAVTPVWDATFGRCARVDGSGGYVSVSDPFPDPSTFTISLWVKPEGVKGEAGYRGFIGKQGDARRKPGMWWIAGRLHYDSYDAATGARFANELNGFFPTEEWTHVAWVKEGTQYRFYRNGALMTTAPAPAQVFTVGGTDYWVGKIDNHFKGRVAAVRVYRRALTPAELWQVTEDDRVVPFRSSHPVDFELYDAKDKHVLYISDHPSGPDHNLHLAIRNTAGRPIHLPTLGVAAPTADKHHFELRFRRGVLSDASVRGLTVAGDAAWKASAPQQTADGVSIFLMRTQQGAAWPMDAGAAVNLVLRSVTAAAQGGARSTRVELLTRAVAYDAAGTAPIREVRSQLVNIVNHVGQKNIPLHAGFVGSNAVLNVGSSDARIGRGGRGNDLRLRIANTLQLDPAYPERSVVAFDTATRLVLMVEMEPDSQPGTMPWALGRAGELGALVVAATPGTWTIEKKDLGQTRQWTLQPSARLQLNAGQAIDVTLSDIVSSLPAGHTNLTVRYENVPGYWDGQWVVPVEKSPLHFPIDGTVGVGTAQPRGFQVVLPEKTWNSNSPGVILSGGRQGNANVELRNGGTGTPYLDFAQRLEIDYDGRLILLAPGRLMFDGSSGGTIGGTAVPAVPPRVGIGVDPAHALDVNGDIVQRGFDFCLGRYNPGDRGDTGFSRALVKDGGSKLTLNYASDFKGGVNINGPVITLNGAVQINNTNQDAQGNSLIIGPTGQSNLRLGYHADYSWIQSHGSKPLSINPVGNNVAVGTTSAGYRLTVSAGSEHLQLRREPAAATGGNLVFLELYQDRNDALNVYPSIRFHHSHKFWHRIEGRPEGLMFKEGNTAGDGLSNIYANVAVLNALKIGGVQIGEHELRILQRLAAGQLDFDLYNIHQNEYAYAADYAPYDNDRRRIFTWRRKGERVNQGRWRITFPS